MYRKIMAEATKEIQKSRSQKGRERERDLENIPVRVVGVVFRYWGTVITSKNRAKVGEHAGEKSLYSEEA